METKLTVMDLMDMKPSSKEQRIKDIYFKELERTKELSKRLRYL